MCSIHLIPISESPNISDAVFHISLSSTEMNALNMLIATGVNNTQIFGKNPVDIRNLEIASAYCKEVVVAINKFKTSQASKL